MASYQAIALKLFFRIDNLLSGPREELDAQKERRELEKMVRLFKYMQEVQTIPISVHGIPAEWILPSDIVLKRTILYLHGGSYIAGSLNSHRIFVANLAAAAKARALIIDYRLAPEFPFPAAIQDAKLAYGWLLENGNSPNEIIIAGDSAGGGLALSLLLVIRNLKQDLPAMAICLSPWTDLTVSGESVLLNAKKDIILNAENLKKAAKLYLGEVGAEDPLASPIFADLKGLSPMLIQAGSDEILLSDSVNLVTSAKAAGVDATLDVWKDMQHVWQFAGSLVPEARQAVSAIGNYIENRWK
ncbi:MAG: hypothetical protein A2X25_11275 [Chloroflexi bacterium GWB2_49_20]|nr:MAG: hypothetical protein A2X25_11275 [Chloroflexi bacterium GWB2_49_20]OGN78869.1 MAG: hypothetical protein A2X26_00075 [Chloroflexi bacterium GWC2_49_37]OGN86371.1 MAG: hypothetical protein A2X27_05700 [Chloroflexi bacterium GWD2_49_16]HBG74606.1 alpha/beta hydrolase [Anaerolineae bacterium]